MERESKRVFFDKHDSNSDTRESVILSELSWFAREAELHQYCESHRNPNLHVHCLSIQLSTDENEHQGSNAVGNGAMRRDPTEICASEDEVLFNQKEQVIEVMPCLLCRGEVKNCEHDRRKSMNKLCELVTRIPNAKGVPLSTKSIRISEPLGFMSNHSSDDPHKASTSSCYLQPSVSSPSVSDSKVGPLVTLTKSCDDTEKSIGFEDDPLASSLAEVNGIAFDFHSASQTKLQPLLKECNGQDGQVEDLVHPTQERLRALENNFDSRLDRAQFNLSSIDPANGMLVPFRSVPSRLRLVKHDEDFVMQGNYGETFAKPFGATHSFHCKNNHCNCVRSSTSPDGARKMNLVESADHGIDGTYLHSSTFTEGGRQFVQNNSVMEFSEATDRHANATVRKIKGDHGVCSVFSETTHRFLITRNTNSAYCTEYPPTKLSRSSSPRNNHTLFGMPGSFLSYPDHDRASMTKPFNKVSQPVSLKEGMLDASCRLHSITEMRESSKQATFSSPKLKTRNHIDVPITGRKDLSEGSCPVLTLEENNLYKNTEEVSDEVHYPIKTNQVQVPSKSTGTEQLDLNIIQHGRSFKDLSCSAHLADCLDADTSCKSFKRTISPSKGERASLVNKTKVDESRRESFGQVQCPDAGLTGKPDSDFRWVKRLKLNDLEAVGTSRSNISDSAAENKRIRLFSKVLNYSRSNSNSDLQLNTSEQTEHHLPQLVERVTLPRQTAPGIIRKSKDMFSNPWIQRWHCPCPQMQSTSMSSSGKPECMKVSVIEMEDKEFPSLGAMALMGKALTNFRRCELMKRGSLVVWKE